SRRPRTSRSGSTRASSTCRPIDSRSPRTAGSRRRHAGLRRRSSRPWSRERAVSAAASEPIIRTVRGDIAPDELGPCDAHEHLFLVTPLQPGDELDDVEKALEEAQALRDAGASAFVDWT